jgi:LysM domain-containing protein
MKGALPACLGLLASLSLAPIVARAQDDDSTYSTDDDQGDDYGLQEAARDRRSLHLGRGRRGVIPEVYTVRRGDTLWDICDYFYDNPWQWPRVWSFNERITNPNWIYPGDPLRLRRGGVETPPTAEGPTPGPRPTARPTPDSVFLRDEGFVEREQYRRAGIVVGSPDERTLLSTPDEVYVTFENPRDVTVGRQYSVFRQVRAVGHGADAEDAGSIVEILGTVKVTSYDRDRNVARATITESLQPIERGHRVGPLERTFTVTPPVRNDIDLVGTVLASLTPVQNIGEQQIVYVDRGHDEGVREGNRFFVVRRGDEYRRSIDRDDLHSGFPYEVIAELRVVEVRRHTATCLVIHSTREVNPGDRAEMRRGY